jgi:hypothetical protein
VQASAQREVLNELTSSGETIRNPVYPAPRGLLTVGMTDNGDVLHWRTVGPPEMWTIVVQEPRGPAFIAQEQNLTGFLAGVLDRSIDCRPSRRLSTRQTPAHEVRSRTFVH